jgi:hypothetical protein
MKYIAIFLILNVLLLSSVTGMANISQGTACAVKMGKDCCKQQKNNSDNDCAKGPCNAMLSCGTCGFIVVQSISLSPAVIDLNRQIIHHFVVDELSDYHDNDWNPPKV